MESIEDLRLWLASSKGILKSANTWGRFVADAKHWPLRRASSKEQAQRLAAQPVCKHGVRPANQCEVCVQERDRVRQAEQAAAEAAKAPRLPTPEQIAALAERRRQAERLEKVNERWMAFWERSPQHIRNKLNRMTFEGFKTGTSFPGDSVDEREAVLDSLENGTHPVFRQVSAVTIPVVDGW